MKILLFLSLPSEINYIEGKLKLSTTT